jgi:DNA polymerase-1
MIQTLTGDTVDGYSGVPKVGAVTANKMLADKDMPVKDMWEIVVKAYEKAGMNEQDALQQARVARILRHGEYDKKTGEVKLWQI